MASNPLVPQGTLNRVRGSLSFNDNASLNLTSSYLTDAGISFSFEGAAVDYLPTMTGAVASPAPYLIVTGTINLVRSQALANAFKLQWESNPVLGDGVFLADSSSVSAFYFNQLAITGIHELDTTGKNPSWVITVTGYYPIASDLWDLV